MRYSELYGLNRISADLIGTESTDIDLKEAALAGILIPDGMVSTSITLKACFTREADTPKVFVPVYDDYGQLITIPIGNTARFISMKRLLPLGLSFIRIVSSAAESKRITVITQEVLPR